MKRRSTGRGRQWAKRGMVGVGTGQKATPTSRAGMWTCKGNGPQRSERSDTTSRDTQKEASLTVCAAPFADAKPLWRGSNTRRHPDGGLERTSAREW